MQLFLLITDKFTRFLKVPLFFPRSRQNTWVSNQS